MRSELISAPASTRDQILKIARHLIQTRSYLGFSFQDIADQIGIRKPSLYHHFESKEALGVAVLREATALFRSWAASTPPTPQKKLAAYFHMYRKGLNAGHGVCPASALAAGWDCIDADLRGAVQELRIVQIQWLTELLGELDCSNRTRSAADSAAFIFAACQGALLSARMTGAVSDFDLSVAHVRSHILE